jgi:HK97 family phage prohead protease
MNQDIKTEFGERVVTLRNGGFGIRAGLNVEVKDLGQDELMFVATDETVDRYNEVIRLDGWELGNYLKNPVVVDSHDYSSVLRIIGNSTSVTISDGKMFNRVRFAMDNPLGKVAYGMARGGFIKSESVGFIPIEWTRGNESQGEPYRTFTKQELLEISLVAVPANPGATLGLALKSGAVTRGDLRDLLDALETFSADKTNPKADVGAPGLGIDGAQLRELFGLPKIRSAFRRA